MAAISRDNVYLYSKRSGRVEVRKGCVRPNTRYKARFIYDRCGKDTYLQCPLEPGVVHAGVVWLTEKDDKKALDLFIEHEQLAIRELEEKIERHEWNIKLLRQGFAEL